MNPVSRLRRIALVEGVSFLVLLLIAMPLKYFADLPIAVKIVGWVHGALFIVFAVVLLGVKLNCRWTLGRSALVFTSALLPFGLFVLARRMAGYEMEAAVDRRP